MRLISDLFGDLAKTDTPYRSHQHCYSRSFRYTCSWSFPHWGYNSSCSYLSPGNMSFPSLHLLYYRIQCLVHRGCLIKKEKPREHRMQKMKTGNDWWLPFLLETYFSFCRFSICSVSTLSSCCMAACCCSVMSVSTVASLVKVSSGTSDMEGNRTTTGEDGLG